MKSPLSALLCLLCILAMAFAICGCRTSELMSCRIDLPPGVTACGAVTINQTLYAEDIGVEQGNTVEAAASAAASVAATLRDITASQSGNATGGSETGDSENVAPVKDDAETPDHIRDAAKLASNPPDAPAEPTTVAAANQPPPAERPAAAGATAGKEDTTADPGGE